ncbi:hypothetical protein [Bradyrhizobium sp. SEMIA]|uniref:hypothetical protein n=1 Tax=Bradyrhizobium sp. SEMIA TaxID=2597515 RepID=UPI0018A5B2E6|nr:hypothetical protein [Bradyrhizobium sp. SEMIA]QOG23314.1 hypothetical protein FOM02_44795 [Bradyrhizobium sp. SEMIA]
MDQQASARATFFLRARIVFEDRNRRRKTFEDASSLVVFILAIKSVVICRPIDVDVDEMPAVGILSFWR